MLVLTFTYHRTVHEGVFSGKEILEITKRWLFTAVKTAPAPHELPAISEAGKGAPSVTDGPNSNELALLDQSSEILPLING